MIQQARNVSSPQQACHDPVKSFCRLFSIWSFHSILQTHLNSGKNSEGLQHTGVLIVVRHYWREPGSLSHLFQPESRLSTFQVVIQHSHCKWPSGVKLVLKLVQWVLKILWYFYLCKCGGGVKASWCATCKSKHPHVPSASPQTFCNSGISTGAKTRRGLFPLCFSKMRVCKHSPRGRKEKELVG